MEEVDKGCRMIRLGVSGWVFLWHQPTRVVPDQQTLNCCVCTVLSHVRLITSLLSHFFNILYQIAISATTLHTFNDPLSGTTWFSQYQKGKKQSGFEWSKRQRHQLGHMQVCTSLQTDNHASTPPLNFLQARCPSCHPTNSVKALSNKYDYLKLTTVFNRTDDQYKLLWWDRPFQRPLNGRCCYGEIYVKEW